MISLNNFQLLKEDDENYHVRHPKGHELKVAKKGLNEKAHQAIKAIPHFAEGGEVPAALAADPTPAQDQALAAEQAPVVVGQVPMALQAPATPVVPQAAQPKLDPMAQNMNDQNSLLDKQEQAINEMTQGQMAGNAQASKAYQDYLTQVKAMQTPQQIAESYKQKDDALMKSYADSGVDPNRYLDKMGTRSKILSGIAIALGGFGTAANGGRNVALDNLHRAINEDIDSQKAQQGKQLNLFKMNHEQMQNETAANLATQNQLWTGVQAKVAQATSTSNNAMAKARGAELINQIEMQKAKNRERLGLFQGGASQVDPLQLVNDFVPKEHQKDVIKEIGTAQSAVNIEKNLKGLFDQAAKDTRPLTGGSATSLMNAVPGYHPQSVTSLEALFDPLIHDEVGRVNEAEQADVRGFIPKFGDSDERVKQKWDGLTSYLNHKKEAPTAKAQGIDIQRFASTSDNPVVRMSPQDQSYYQWAVAHPSSPVSQAFFQKHGLNK